MVADCIIGFAFGYRKEGEQILPGLSNEDLARIAEQYLSDIPLILQFEIADIYQGKGKVFRIEEHRSEGQYLDTREVAEQALAIMENHGWQSALLLAHPDHLPRVKTVCEKLGIKTVIPTNLEVRFDPESEQEWTRSKEAWGKREKQVVEYYKKQGWI